MVTIEELLEIAKEKGRAYLTPEQRLRVIKHLTMNRDKKKFEQLKEFFGTPFIKK